MILIAQVYSYCISITKSKVFSIIIAIINSETSSNGIYSFNSYSISIGFSFNSFEVSNDDCFSIFENGVAELYVGRESLCTGTSLYDSTPL